MRYSFAGFTLDVRRRELAKADATVPVEPKTFDILHLLLANAGGVVSRDQLVDVVWDGRIVSDAAISARIAAARKAVGDDGKTQNVIRTVPRRGLMLVADVSLRDDETEPVTPPATTRASSDLDIAVARFTANAADAELCEAATDMREQLLARLARRSGLAIVALEEPESRREPHAYVLRGRLTRSASSMRAAVSLILGDTSQVAWSEIYEADADPPAFVDDVVGSVSNALRVQINAYDGERVAGLPEASLPPSALRAKAAQAFHAATLESHADAERFLRRALELEPEDPMSLAMLAYALSEPAHARYEQVSPDNAAWIRDAVNTAARLAPHSDFVIATRADMLNKVFGDLDGAERDIGRALKINESYAWGLDTEGRIHLARGDNSAAATIFAKAIAADARDPWQPRRHFLKALAQFLAGDASAAVRTVEDAIALRPDSRAFWLLSAEIAAELSDAEAERRARAQAAQLPDVPDFHAMWVNLPEPARFVLERLKPVARGETPGRGR